MKWILSLTLFYAANILAAPTLNFVTTSQVVNEKIRDVAIAVELSAPTVSLVKVSFEVSGNADFGPDHDLNNGEFIIEPGQTIGHITFRIHDDGINEGSENIIVDLLSVQNAILGANITHQIDIEDMSLDLPVLSWSNSATLIYEGTTIELEASIDKVSANTVLAFYKVSGSSTFGSDHNLGQGFIEIVPGTLSSSLSIEIASDIIAEADETLVVRLISPVNNAQLGEITKHVVTIHDAGSPPLTTWYGTTYALEFNNIREIPGDDNPSRSGYKIDSSNNILELWSQFGSAYSFKDISHLNASLVQTTTDPRVSYINLASEVRQTLSVNYGGYLVDFDFWTDENSNGSVDAGEARARIGIAQNQLIPPYVMQRPTVQYDFSLLAGNTYTGITLEQGILTDHNDFAIYDGTGGCSNSITFGATATANISGSICMDASNSMTINTDQNLLDPSIPGDNSIAGNHGIYVGGTAFGNDGNVTSIAIVASPDGNAIVVASCLDASCQGNFSEMAQYFDINTLTNLSSMRFSILTKQ